MQLALIGAAGLIALIPGSQGQLLVTPIMPGSERGLFRWIAQSDASLVQQGGLPNSIIVKGRFTQLFPIALAHGSLLVPVPAQGCFSVKETDNDR